MARSILLALLGAVAAVGGSQACTTGSGREDLGIQRVRLVLCEKALECGCAPAGVEIDCGAWPPEDDPQAIYGQSFAFDDGCVESWVRWAEALTCDDARLPSYAEVCPLYHGAALEGQPCEAFTDFDDDVALQVSQCSRGLYCLAGACRDPARTSLGAEDQPCDIGGRCDAGLACVDQLCQRLPGAGEPCLSGTRCDAGSFCDFEQCRDKAGPGEPCDFAECEEGSRCGFDVDTGELRCLLTGVVGDPCQGHRDCQSGNCPAGFCEEPAGIGDPCGSRLPCGPGLSCREGQCEGGSGTSTCGVLLAP